MSLILSRVESNREKHGVDFVQAQELWQDPLRIEVPARTTGEPRWLVVGRWATSTGQRS
ncbi:MAG: BrnT family toxin [Trebonia sp.]